MVFYIRGSYGREQRPWSKFWVIKIRAVFFTLLQCLKVVISSFEPFPSDFEGGLRFRHLGGGGGRSYVKKEDPGQCH